MNTAEEIAAELRAIIAEQQHGAPATNGHHPEEPERIGRQVRFTNASIINPRPVRWLWDGRVPAGEITMTPGRGGIGKSTFHTWIIAHVTRGTLPGIHEGAPKPCVVATSEDSWECTVVPRLIVAGADLDLVKLVDVEDLAGHETSLTLPVDLPGLEDGIRQLGAAVLSIDPLMSSIHGGLDTHKDRDVRQALEPLHRLADRTRCSVLGNAHFNKGVSTDALTLLTGSAAFGNVPRAVLAFARDPDEDNSCVISQVKNNLGRLDLPSLRYQIEEVTLDTLDGDTSVGRLVMVGESDRSVNDILSDRSDTDEKTEAVAFLESFIPPGEWVKAKDAMATAKSEGIAERTLQRTRRQRGYQMQRIGFGAGSVVWWGHTDATPIDAIGASDLGPGPIGPGPKNQAPMAPMERGVNAASKPISVPFNQLDDTETTEVDLRTHPPAATESDEP